MDAVGASPPATPPTARSSPCSSCSTPLPVPSSPLSAAASPPRTTPTAASPPSTTAFTTSFSPISRGFVEDQFGLGLIARAVEEGIAVIKPMGIMVFNIGGRPGQGVCQRLFECRGFQVMRLWRTKSYAGC